MDVFVLRWYAVGMGHEFGAAAPIFRVANVRASLEYLREATWVLD